MAKTFYEGKVLESTTRKDGGKFWVIRAFRNEDGVFTQTESWKTTAKGESKHVLSVPYRVEVKNVGRANETTLENQAIAEAESDVKKKLDSGYWPMGEERPADELPLPMLAMQGPFKDNKHYVTYPAAIQPKFDGHRMLFDGVKGWTRKRQLVPAECIAHLLFDTGGVVLDGELMLPHDKFGFEAGTGAAKAFKPDLSPQLVYYVYDYIDENETFRERNLRLKQMAKEFPPNVLLAQTRIVKSEEEALEVQGEFVQEGHEGAILRNLGGAYRLKDRSHDLIKVKGDMIEEEFTITAVNEGDGKFEGRCATFSCAKDGRDVGKATPKGSFEQKRQYFINRKSLLGKQVTVKFQGWGTGGKMRFPVALRIREDL